MVNRQNEMAPSRRSIAKGAAWGVPAIAVTAAAPAVAASATCTPTIDFSGGTAVDWGSYTAPTSTQQVSFGGQVTVNNLPVGVTVTKVTEQWFVENAIGQDSSGNGYWFMGNSKTNWYKSGACTATGCSVQWTAPIGRATNWDYTTAPGAGWLSTVTNTVNNAPTVFSDGVTRNAWDATMTWSGTDTASATGCRDFVSDSGKFGVNYINSVRKSTTATVSMFVKVTATLSNGQTLTYTSSTATTHASW